MLGDKIRMFRQERNLATQTLAELVGVSEMAIQYYEENKWRPGTDVIARLAYVLDVQLTDIVEGCTLLRNEKGEMLMVCTDTGKKVKVLGRITEEVQQVCRREASVS